MPGHDQPESAVTRLRNTQLLQSNGHATLNDMLYAAVCDSIDVKEQDDLVPYLSEPSVDQLLDAQRSCRLEASTWRRLSRRYPAIASSRLQTLLDHSGTPTRFLLQSVQLALKALRASAPDQGMALLQHAVRRLNPRALPLGAYASLFPIQVARLVMDMTQPVALAWTPNALRRLDHATLVSLEACDALVNLASVFKHLHTAQRRALYQARKAAWRDSFGAMPLVYLEALPGDLREAEAQHAWSLPLLQSRPQQRLPYLALLPLELARSLAEPFLAQPEGELRALAIAALVKGRRYHAVELNSLLAFCGNRVNEQDPVRLAMIDALAGLQPSRWQTGHLTSLKGVIDAALIARDCSHQTMVAAARLLLAMIAGHTEFVVAQLPRLVERNGSLNVARLESRLNDEQMREIAPHLMPLLKTWMARDQTVAVLALILGFGLRAQAVPEFTSLVVELVFDPRGHVARTGLQALLRLKQRAEVAKLIPQLLAEDESWIQVHEVAKFLHARRQTLLTPFLAPRNYKGRFANGDALTLPQFDAGFERWTPAQQETYARSLQDLANGGKRSAWELFQVVERLSAMPSIDVQPLVELARLEAPDKALRDRALEALGRCDAGRGVPALLDALDDERARIAIYALRRCLLTMPTDHAISLLGSVQVTKLTVLKEVIRLAGELGGDASFAFLAGFSDKENLRPDAQMALLRAYWNHLNRDEVWPRLHDAARSERAALARSTIRIPQSGLLPPARQKLCLHLTLLLQHPDAQVCLETLQRLVAMPPPHVDKPMLDAASAFLMDVDPQTNRLAAQALLVCGRSVQGVDIAAYFVNVTYALALQAVVQAYEQCRLEGLKDLEVSADKLIAALLQRRKHPDLALRLAVSQLTPIGALRCIKEADEAGLLHPGAVDAVAHAWHGIAGEQALLSDVEDRLREADSPGQRRLGLALLVTLAERHGWTSERRAQLGQYKQDVELWISNAAELIAPPPSIEAAAVLSE